MFGLIVGLPEGFYLATVRWPGLPAASYFLLLRQKKVTKEKATPLIPETPEIEPAGWASKNSPRFC